MAGAKVLGTPSGASDVVPKSYVDAFFLHGLTGIWIGTQAEYDAIGSKVSTVLYAITP